jgi:NADH-quinone oxidoreductase subunit G
MPGDKNNMVTLTIDGRQVTVPRGSTVLEAARELGIEIPTFCWHPKLKPVGACRMCYVEIEKRPKLEVSCATPVMPDMIVHTNSEKVKQGRRAVIEFILLNHPLDCPTCDKGGECDLQDLTFAHGLDDSRFDFGKYRYIRDRQSTFDDWRLGPEIIRNQNRCILCFKCVRANKEIFGEFDLGVFQRGNITEIDAAPGEKVDSIYSGNLVEICPVGALTNTDWRYKIRVWKTATVKTICPYCADGCNLTLWKNSQGPPRLFRATSRRNDAIDEGWICDVGRYGYQIAHPDGRLTTPLVKKGDAQVPVNWEEALGLIARKFKEIKDEKGGVCIGGLISPSLDCRSLYVFSKFFRTLLNSNNVDYRIDYKMLPEGYGDLYSRLASTEFNIADIEKSDLILVVNSNLIKEHPIVNLRVRKAVSQKGARLYTLNPFATSSGEISDDEMIYTPGAMEALINGLCISLVEQGISSLTISDSDLRASIDPRTVDDAAAASGIDKERINSLARALGQAKNITLIAGEILTASPLREKMAAAILNLIHLAGIFGRGQVGFLPRYANSKGAEKLGVMPHLSGDMIRYLKGAWRSYPDSDGLAADRMILSAKKEEIDSLFIVGANLLVTYPDGQFVRDGLETLDFLVAADLYESETTVMADVVLPLSGWAEYDGRFINLEGTVQEFNRAIKPVGHSLPAYEIIARLAAEMKTALYGSLQDLDAEMAALLSLSEQREFERRLNEVSHVPEKVLPEFPLPLYVIDELHHFGHLTEKSKSLSTFCGEAFAEISPALAEKFDAADGMLMRVESEVGKIVLPVKISHTIDHDTVLIPRNFPTSPPNVLQMRKRRIDRVRLTRIEEK